MKIRVRSPTALSGVLLLLIVLLNTSGCVRQSDPAELPPAPLLFAAVDELLDEALANREFAYAEVGIYRDGQAVFVTHKGDLPQVGTEGRALFRIASMTKPITAVAVLQLVAAGAIDLHAPIATYIPDFAQARVLAPCSAGETPPCTTTLRRPITIEDLLLHRSGMPYANANADLTETSGLYFANDLANGVYATPQDLASVAQTVARIPLSAQPGEQWEYGYASDVLSRVVEIACACTFDEYLRENIFDPLGMADTFFLVPLSERGRLAPVTRRNAEGDLQPLAEGRHHSMGLPFDVKYPVSSSHRMMSGGGGLVSSLEDYRRFAQMLLNEGRLGEVEILDPSWVRRMTSPHICDAQTGMSGLAWGYGIGVANAGCSTAHDRTQRRFGWQGIFFTSFQVDPATNSIVIFLAQHRPDQRSAIARTIQFETLQILNETTT